MQQKYIASAIKLNIKWYSLRLTVKHTGGSTAAEIGVFRLQHKRTVNNVKHPSCHRDHPVCSNRIPHNWNRTELVIAVMYVGPNFLTQPNIQ